MSCEVIVVDDGSTDRTVAMVERFFQTQQGGKVLKNDKNQGKGFSVKRGVRDRTRKRMEALFHSKNYAPNMLNL